VYVHLSTVLPIFTPIVICTHIITTLANTWTILWYPLQLYYSCCSVEFYCIYYCFLPYV